MIVNFYPKIQVATYPMHWHPLASISPLLVARIQTQQGDSFCAVCLIHLALMYVILSWRDFICTLVMWLSLYIWYPLSFSKFSSLFVHHPFLLMRYIRQQAEVMCGIVDRFSSHPDNTWGSGKVTRCPLTYIVRLDTPTLSPSVGSTRCTKLGFSREFLTNFTNLAFP